MNRTYGNYLTKKNKYKPKDFHQDYVMLRIYGAYHDPWSNRIKPCLVCKENHTGNNSFCSIKCRDIYESEKRRAKIIINELKQALTKLSD